MIVVDASALAAFIMMEESSRKIVDYLKEGISVDHIIKEVGNTIWKAYIRGYVTAEDAVKRFEILMETVGNVIELVSEVDLIREAMKIAMENNITLYDALYVALALKMRIPLLTMDKGQAETAKKYGLNVIKP
ncbi:type II toxin-antitoxin system VapC family toxin [Candidatus Bathyarchaeota archaeon]|nr:type II toxin-antitoxin system VapC family toxin [Candidatus Bathyarchaeota archaeon]